jgi:predicted DNA-binding transcriptional regulator AlpA
MNTRTQPTTEPLTPILVNAADAGRLLGLSRATIFGLNSAGKIPRPLRPTGSDPRWSVAELRAWIDAGCPNRESWETQKAGRR